MMPESSKSVTTKSVSSTEWREATAGYKTPESSKSATVNGTMTAHHHGGECHSQTNDVKPTPKGKQGARKTPRTTRRKTSPSSGASSATALILTKDPVRQKAKNVTNAEAEITTP
jgi:hypothetical protein